MKRGAGYIALLSACTLVACTSSPEEPTQISITIVQSHKVQLLTYQLLAEQVGEAQAAFDGKFVIDDTKCLALVSGDQQIGIVVPEGTTVSGDQSLVIFPDGSQVSRGGSVQLGGGYYSPDQLPKWKPDNSCQYGEYFVVNQAL